MEYITAYINKDKDKGQALVETALVLLLLLLIVLGIAEYSRAYFKKSSLKNGTRQGARVAAVTPHIASTSSAASCGGTITCSPLSPALSTTCTSAGCNDGYIEAVVCCTPGVGNNVNTSVSITVTDINGNLVSSSTDAQSGNTIDVNAANTFTAFFPKIIKFLPATISADASFRYE